MGIGRRNRNDDKARESYHAPAKRVEDDITRSEPDRIPVVLAGGLLAADHVGLTIEETMYDAEKLGEATKQFVFDLQTDNAPRNFTPLAKMLDELDYTLIDWPGHNWIQTVHSSS